MLLPSSSMEMRRAGSATVALGVSSESMPPDFPMSQWSIQAQRYIDYWHWFDGTEIEEEIGTTKRGEPIYRFPLRINSIRTFARKHASVLLGEEMFESPEPLVRTRVTPKHFMENQKTTDEERQESGFLQAVVSDVWRNSNGRSLQMENAVISQFLGGCVFGVKYQPWRDDLAIPIIVESIMPDFFLPVWRKDNYYSLLECWIVYRVPARVAALEWQYDVRGSYVLYVEHWTSEKYSIYLDNKPLVDQFGIVYKDLDNPWGEVPFVYIPHAREGDFYGSSHVEDLRGLVMEFNARLADYGDAVRKTVHRVRYAINLTSTPVPRQIGENIWVIDLGRESPAYKNPPNIKTEDPPDLAASLTSFSEKLWNQLMRESSLSNIAFGEDEGSQRSALTLAFRMWPTTAHARVERSHWTDGLNRIAYLILKIVAICQADKSLRGTLSYLPATVPLDFSRRYRFAQDWAPQIPRDREQMVNEIVLRSQAGLLSPERAMEAFGDVQDIEQEKKFILDWMEKVQKVKVPGQKPPQTQISGPIATTGLEEIN